MKKNFYPKLAWSGIRKNSRLYMPYLCTCIGVIMMYYIISFLSRTDAILNMRGGATMQSMLGMGTTIISIFAVIFLFYTNSFLIRRRKKEFGLYNILGMGKRNLLVVLIWETLIIASISLSAGLVLGIVFSKFAELAMINILQGDVSFALTVKPESIVKTLVVFAVIFFLILLNTLRQIQLSNPIELLRSENTGEKPPKANWILAAAGAVILAAAYYVAVTIENPMETLTWFFVAVIMVIIATYLLFVAGSVAICRILQKNKRYYYKTNHFVSISSMVYRMKRNGAGLASICILCTMVLVMISSTVCLYVGTEDSLRTRYPRNINIDAKVDSPTQLKSDEIDKIRQIADQAMEENGQPLENTLEYRAAALVGYVKDGKIITDEDTVRKELQSGQFSNLWQIFMVSLEDYNRLMGQDETLESDEVLLYTTKLDYEVDVISIGDVKSMKVKKTVDDFMDNGIDTMQIVPSMYLFLPDYYENLESCVNINTVNTMHADASGLTEYHWFFGFDMDVSDETQMEIQEQIEQELKLQGLMEKKEDGSSTIVVEGVAEERSFFYGLYGGLFFLGILLGAVFIFAAVLIMYYKQISEGYEDQSRFEIMQKVGMTKKDIKRSINSQVLTVFFLPLAASGVHLAFAFPMIQKLLLLLGLSNMNLLILVTVISFLVFALFYVIVYQITSRSYYNIVSGVKE